LHEREEALASTVRGFFFLSVPNLSISHLHDDQGRLSLRIGYALESDLTFCRRLMHVLLPFRVTIRTGLSNGVSYCRLTG
jgi:hypothetical protein